MTRRRELFLFAALLAALVAGLLNESLIGDKVLSSADVLLVSASFAEVGPPHYEPINRLLMDPTLQFEPWIEFNRAMLRSGRLPLWNSASGCGAPHLANGQAAVFDPFMIIAYLGTLPHAFAWMAATRLWFAGVGMFLLARAWSLGPWGRWFAGLVYPISGFLVAWLLYPVTNVAIWMPWVFLATQALWDEATSRRGVGLAVAMAGTLLGGHVQTAAHVLLAAGAYVAFLTWRGTSGGAANRVLADRRDVRDRPSRRSRWCHWARILPEARSGGTVTLSGFRSGRWRGHGSLRCSASPCRRSTGVSGVASQIWPGWSVRIIRTNPPAALWAWQACSG